MNGPESARNDADAAQTYMVEIARFTPLSRSEENRLGDRLRAGDPSARQRLIEANLRFVVFMALQYRNRGIPLADLISAGNVGLIVASGRFDPARGFKFISYAVWWIRQAIQRAIHDCGRTVRIPANRVELLQRISRCVHYLTQVKQGSRHEGFSPTNEEVALECDRTSECLADTLAMGQNTISLNFTPDGDESRELLETLADAAQELPDQIVSKDHRKQDIEAALGTLESREREVIKLYFGLEDGSERTLEEIGSMYDLSRERARQIKAKGLRKLRHSTRGARLFAHYEASHDLDG